MSDLKKIPLHQEHLKVMAKFAPFAGFEMPLQYTSVKEEVQVVRSGAGIFDVSHMGEFMVTGREAVAFVDSLITNDLRALPVQKAIYSPLCNEAGKILDDLIVYKLGEQELLVCVNASNIEKDWNHFQKYHQGFDCTLKNISSVTCLLALQGPQSVRLLAQLGVSLEGIPYYGIKKIPYRGEDLIIARTGYTGEDGVELFCSEKLATYFWSELLNSGAKPCGLAARDVLRLEVGYPLYGHELTEDLNPLDCGLKWTVKLKKDKFVGKAATAKHEIQYQLIKLTLEKAIPRAGYEIVNAAGKKVGMITSGTFSPTIGQGIAMGLVAVKEEWDPKNFTVKIRETNHQATYHLKPFVQGGHL